MNKLSRVMFDLLILAVSLPMVKGIFDWLTEPVTGWMIVNGAQDWEIAIAGAVPWIFPLGVFIMLIIDLTKKDSDGIRR